MKNTRGLVSGKVYVVKSGKHKGCVGLALSRNDWGHEYDGSSLYSPDFVEDIEDDGYLSFLGVTNRLRLATAKEELKWRKEWAGDIPTVPEQW